MREKRKVSILVPRSWTLMALFLELVIRYNHLLDNIIMHAEMSKILLLLLSSIPYTSGLATYNVRGR
jgi:hypothetical protein